MQFFTGEAFGGFLFVGRLGGKMRSCCVVGDWGYEVPLGHAFGGEWVC